MSIPDSKVHGANIGPTWVLSAPDGPHVGPMNLAIRDSTGVRFPEWLSGMSNVHITTVNGRDMGWLETVPIYIMADHNT